MSDDLRRLAQGYDEIPYRTTSRRWTHPVDMATQATLFGVPSVDPTTAHVLEIGCGDGVNLLAMAESLPKARFVGIDIAAAPIARAQAAASELGLTNVEFASCDLRELPTRLVGPYDFVVAHGLYSWVPPDVRDGLLGLIDKVLAPDGLAYVSYNCYPGSFARDAIRDALAYALADGLSPTDQVDGARRLLRVLAAGSEVPGHGEDVARHAAYLLQQDDWSLFHDELSPWCDAVYLHEFVAHAQRHGLGWLFEARLVDGVQANLSPDVRGILEDLPNDVVVREQYLDLLRGRMFRESLLRRGAIGPERRLQVAAIEGCWVSAAGELSEEVPGRVTFQTGLQATLAEGCVADAITQVMNAWPAAVPVASLVANLERDETGRVLDTIARLHAVAAVQVRVAPARTARAGERPRVSRIARWQAASGMDHVTSSTHDPVALQDDVGRRMVALLDGTRTIDDLVHELSDIPDVRAGIETSLDALERIGMFVAYD